MSEEGLKTLDNNNAAGQGRKLVKVKRLKPKNDVMPRPEEAVYAPNYSEQALAALNQQSSELESEAARKAPKFIEEDEDYANQPTFLRMLKAQPLKMLVLGSIASFIVGFGIAKLTTSSNTTVHEGLQGVVVNPEIPKGRARCGLVERTQGCVIYVMNPQRQDLNARDFFELAARQTGRQRFVIDTANMRYSNVKIKPGAIAQINIPPL